MFEMAFDDEEESWRTIRAVRTMISKDLRGDRRITFNSALEQAQEQFRAATITGYASRPVNLFYGLSQAGRALAAAFESTNWQPRGHGLQLSKDEESGLFTRHVRPQGQSNLFASVSRLLDSPYDFSPVDLETLGRQLPEATLGRRANSGWSPRVIIDPPYVLGIPEGAESVEAEVPLLGYRDGMTAAEVRAELDRYPVLTSVALQNDANPLSRNNPGWASLKILPSQLRADGYLDGTVTYRGGHVLMPSLGETGRSLHPLMTWWLLLYAFSMTARYEPSAWTRSLDVSQSLEATHLELLLDVALAALPNLLAEAMLELAP